jgi:2-polyprenyl-3-methyl-5-hydroxy-6-metoxy-1,4-benzoquinol methylase
MGDCCDPGGYEATFSEAFARRRARRYRRRGPTRVERRLVGFLIDQGIEGATILEIGGGVGEVQVELLRAGAARVTNLEISPSYEAEARQLLETTGFSGRVDRRIIDIAAAPDEVEPADVVVLNRVVCCYENYPALLAAAGSHSRRLLVFSHPPRSALLRALFAWDNVVRRLRRNDFRGFVHPPEAMLRVLEAEGLAVQARHHSWDWDVVGLARTPG